MTVLSPRIAFRTLMVTWRLPLGLATLLVTGLLACAPAVQVELDSPQERQIFQRDPDGGAHVPVRGRWHGEGGDLEVRARLADGSLTTWQPAVPGPPGEDGAPFEAVLRLPAGGWHSLLARYAGSEEPWELIRRVGVGELFVVAGQSNSSNCGVAPMAGGNDRVSAFDGRRWSLATDPMPGVQDGSNLGSPWPVLGDMLQRALGVPVGIASTGHGGSSVDDWQPRRPPVSSHIEQALYPALPQRISAMGDIRAVLWHQGEKDAKRGMKADDYVRSFRRIQQALEADTGRPVAWVAARVSFLPRNAPGPMREIRRAQEELWRRGWALPGPSTDELQGRLRGPDGAHFSRRGLRVHAELWFAKLWTQFFSVPPLRLEGVEPGP